MDYFEIFRSVELVWAIWLTSVILFVVLFRRVLRFLRRFDCRVALSRFSLGRLHGDQEGATYSMSFILVLPFLVFLIAMIIETTFILVTKIGTMHAAYAAARTGAVWSTEDTANRADSNGFISLAQSKAKQAAVLAMVPYAAGKSIGSEFEEEAQKYYELYDMIKASSPSPGNGYSNMNPNYVKNKYKYAMKSVHVDLSLEKSPFRQQSGNGQRWEQFVQAKVSYEYPFHVIPVGRSLMGKRNSDNVLVYEITSTAYTNNECPRNEKGKLGIRIVP